VCGDLLSQVPTPRPHNSKRSSLTCERGRFWGVRRPHAY
jgi:hypothetical protein